MPKDLLFIRDQELNHGQIKHLSASGGFVQRAAFTRHGVSLIRWLRGTIIAAHTHSRRVEQRHRLTIIFVRVFFNMLIT